MKWWPWHRHEPDGEHARATEAEARAQMEDALKRTRPQVEQAIRAAAAQAKQADRFARAIEDAMKPRGV